MKYSFLLSLMFYIYSNSYIITNRLMTQMNNKQYNPFARKYFEEISRRKNEKNNTDHNVYNNIVKKYPLTRPDFIETIRRLNSNNNTIRDGEILGLNNNDDDNNDEDEDDQQGPQLRIVIGKPNFLKSLGIKFDDDDEETNGNFEEDDETGRKKYVERPNSKSKNFQVIKNYNILFKT